MEDDFKGGRCLLSGDAPSNVSTVESAKFSLHLRLPRCPLQAELNKMGTIHTFYRLRSTIAFVIGSTITSSKIISSTQNRVYSIYIYNI